MDISVIIPVYNEEAALPELYRLWQTSSTGDEARGRPPYQIRLVVQHSASRRRTASRRW
jgi:glycosyltransferase involved in cell wall biosynthesis